MEYNQRAIISFRLNKETDARDIADRVEIQFGEHTYALRAIQIWVTKVQFGRQDHYDEIRTEDLLLMILIPKFW
jgi:hypothetical protein